MGKSAGDVYVSPLLEDQITARGALVVDDAYGGRVFLRHTFAPTSPLGNLASSILPSLGALFTRESRAAYAVLAPDPVRLAAYAAEQRIPLGFNSDSSGTLGGMNPRRYGAIVLEGCHPVSTGNLDNYGHDALDVEDHMGAVVLCRDGLFNLYRGRVANPSDLVAWADLHDNVSGKIGEALACLFRDNLAGLAAILDNDLPHILSKHSSDPLAHDQNDSRLVRQMLSGGLDRLGVSHPPILELSDRECPPCRWEGK